MREQVQNWVENLGLPGWMVPDYWFMLTLAIIVASLLTILLCRRTGSSDLKAADLIFWGVPSLFIGARFFSWLQFGFPVSFEEAWHGSGFALFGGLVGLLLAWSIYYLVWPYPILEFLDCVAPGLALGLTLGRIGCFMAGCDGGIPSALPWAVHLPPGTTSFHSQHESGLIPPDAELSLSAHPTQLYESLFGLAAFLGLFFLLRYRKKPGEVFITGMLWYGIFRLVSEPLRAPSGGWHPTSWLTFAQLISLFLIAGSLIGLRYLKKRRVFEGV